MESAFWRIKMSLQGRGKNDLPDRERNHTAVGALFSSVTTLRLLSRAFMVPRSLICA